MLPVRSLALVFACCGIFTSVATAQDWTMWQGPRGGVRLRVRLRDKSENAAKHLAAVEAEVQNVWLHYPNPVPQRGIQAAVLQYQVDSCPPVLTTDTRIRFDQLSAGDHSISVALLGSDNKAISPSVRLELKVP